MGFVRRAGLEARALTRQREPRVERLPTTLLNDLARLFVYEAAAEGDEIEAARLREQAAAIYRRAWAAEEEDGPPSSGSAAA